MSSAVVPQLKYLQFQVLCINCFILKTSSQPYPDHTGCFFSSFSKGKVSFLFLKCLSMSRRPLRILHISSIKFHFINWASYEIGKKGFPMRLWVFKCLHNSELQFSGLSWVVVVVVVVLLISLVLLLAVNCCEKNKHPKSTLLAEHLRGREHVIFYLIEEPAGQILHFFLFCFFVFVCLFVFSTPIIFSSDIRNLLSNY